MNEASEESVQAHVHEVRLGSEDLRKFVRVESRPGIPEYLECSPGQRIRTRRGRDSQRHGEMPGDRECFLESGHPTFSETEFRLDSGPEGIVPFRRIVNGGLCS